MAINHLQLPAYNAGNALDFRGLNSGIDSIQQQRQFSAQNALAQSADQRANQLHGVQMAGARTQQEMQQARMAAGRVQGIMSLPKEQQGAAWAAVRRMPGFNELGPEFDDLSFAAPLIMAKAREYLGEKDQAQLGLVRAQTGLAQANAAKAQREAAMGGEQPANIREWNAFQRMTPEQQQQYLTMKRAQPWLNAGTQFVSPNQANPSGPPTATVPIDVAGKSAAQKAGEHQGGEPQRVEGRTRLDTVLGGVTQDYLDLNKTGGVVNPDRGAMDNLAARAKSTGIGQTIAGATGSQEQSIRERINNARPLLIQGIMQATGMSARALDSNRELEFYLSAVTDPTKDLHSNLVAIDVLDKTYGLGNVLQRTIPKELYERVSRDAQRQMQTRPIPTDARGAGSFAAPAGGGWSIRKVD